MVIVTGVLGIELPGRLDALTGVAQHLDLSTAQAVHLLDDRLAEIGLERFSVGGHRAEQHAGDILDCEGL